MSIATEQEQLSEYLRSERRWALAERIAQYAVAVCCGVILLGLVGAVTVVFMDAAQDAPQSVQDNE